MHNYRHLIGFIVVVVLVGTACGQKPGVSEQAAPGTAIVDPQTGEVIDPATGEVISDGGSTDLGGGLTGGGTTTGGGGTTSTTSGGGSSTSGGGGTGGGGGGSVDDPAGAPQGGDATGVTGKLVTLGTHAPLTGAAPVPSDSVEKGKDLYFRWIQEELGTDINGRKVEVILKNDNYNPSQAVAVCKEMVEQDKVFFISGAAGTDQIVACARYAASVDVPYLSAGVTRIGLEGLPNYFATSMPYPDQGVLLADFLVTNLGAKGEKNGMLYFNTGNFKDAHDVFAEAMSDKGAPLDYDRAVRKTANKQDADAVVQEMSLAGIQNVYVLTSPVWWIQVLDSAQKQGYSPQWVGVGISMTFDTIAGVGCRNGTINAAKFFAPFPAWSDSNKFDPDFRAASNKYTNKGNGDDFMWLSWLIGKTGAQFLELPGRELTRERFVWFLERARNLKNGVGPVLNYTPEDHFGADQVHVSEAQCSGYKAGDARWHTLQSFISDF